MIKTRKMGSVVKVPGSMPRKFVAKDFQVTDWEQLLPYFQRLLECQLDTVEQVEDWLRKSSELEFVLSEDKAWRFIKMTCDTTNETHKQSFETFISEILPHLSIKANELQKKLYDSPGFKQLDKEKYKVLIRSTKKQIELFREENVPLNTEINRRSREFDEMASGLSIEQSGEKITLQRAAKLLEDKSRESREAVWQKITAARLEKRDQVNQLLTDLIRLRTKVAQNAGYDSFAKYKFELLGRFDYSPEDCYAFHNSVEKVIKPHLLALSRERKANLGVEVLRHWDINVDEHGRSPLVPFLQTTELTEKSIRIFDRLNPKLAEQIRSMREMGHLDLESRLGKAPGGYNYSLPETGVPFIFMNAVGTQGDLTTMVHELGHAVHSFASQHLDIAEYKHVPAELAELASMSMELFTMDFWDEFYQDPRELKRAKREQLVRVFTLLPWIASIDAFQFWLYDHPDHSYQERDQAWREIFARFHGDYVSWDGYEDVLGNFWQKQGHIFDVPFYYIEYGIAQLAAVAVWRNYRNDPENALDAYLRALSLGYSRPIPEIYEAAGIKFDFSEAYIRELATFVAAELDALA